jgi:hypothetical protein
MESKSLGTLFKSLSFKIFQHCLLQPDVQKGPWKALGYGTWNTDQVCDWLEQVDLQQFVQQFQENKVDGGMIAKNKGKTGNSRTLGKAKMKVRSRFHLLKIISCVQ